MAKSDARRFRRISLNLPAHITVNASDEAEGRLLNMSPGDLAVLCDLSVMEGDAVVMRIPSLDVIEGTIARVLPDGFALSFRLPMRRRMQLTEKLMLLANAQYKDGLEDRRASPRHRAGLARTVCRLADGSSLFVKIVDKSVDGVAVDAPRRPPVGSPIHIGRRRGVVIRHTPRGFVAIFDAGEMTGRPALRAV